MFRSKKLGFILAATAAALAVGSFAFAAIPTNGVIHGCYNKSSGALRVFDSAANQPKTCTGQETAIDWNQQGPKGDRGPSNAYTRDWSYEQVPANGWTTVASRTVPAGTYLLSAKLYVTPDIPNMPATAVTCMLAASGGNGGTADYAVGTVSSDGPGDDLVASMALENDNTSTVLASNGGTVYVACNSTEPVEAHQVKITALQVASLDYQ